jgi:hypothetical protein
MVAATVLGIFLIPLLYLMVRRLGRGKHKDKHKDKPEPPVLPHDPQHGGEPA